MERQRQNVQKRMRKHLVGGFGSEVVAVIVLTGAGVIGFAVVTGLVVVLTGAAVVGFVVVGAAEVGAGGGVAVLATMLVAFVAAVVVALVAVVDGSCVACVLEVVTAAGVVATATVVGRVVAAATIGMLRVLESLSDGFTEVASSVGVHAGSCVACSVVERDGRATDWFAAPPAIVTAPADSGPLNSVIMPMMPVRMNVVISHSCHRLARTPMRKVPQ
jgi:hypothetical protein